MCFGVDVGSVDIAVDIRVHIVVYIGVDIGRDLFWGRYWQGLGLILAGVAAHFRLPHNLVPNVANWSSIATKNGQILCL